MKNKKIIITISNEEERRKYELLGITHFAYPLDGFCVGIPNTFSRNLIKSDGYILVNRILDNDGINKLKEILANIKVKGIIFDDLGIIPLVKDKPLEKILYLSHFNANKESIKIYLDYVDSVVVSTDIKKEEVENIVSSLKNKLTLFVLGYTSAMYSRRLLIDNYSKFHHIKKENPLEITLNEQKFLVYENEYGTIFYHLPLFNGLELMNLDAKYFLINTSFLSFRDVSNLLNGTYKGLCDDGFLHKDVIYKLRSDDND